MTSAGKREQGCLCECGGQREGLHRLSSSRHKLSHHFCGLSFKLNSDWLQHIWENIFPNQYPEHNDNALFLYHGMKVSSLFKFGKSFLATFKSNFYLELLSRMQKFIFRLCIDFFFKMRRFIYFFFFFKKRLLTFNSSTWVLMNENLHRQ